MLESEKWKWNRSVVPTLSNPMDCSLPGSSAHGIFQARVLEWVAIAFSNAWKWKVKVKSLSRVHLFSTPWTAAYQAPLPMGFSRQEYWSGVPLLPTNSKTSKPFTQTTPVQFSSVTQSCPTLCGPMNCSMPGLPVHHQLPESTQTHVHCVSDAIQPSHPLLSPSPPALHLS